MKHAIVSVINDLITDNRVHKSCLTLQKAGYEVLLVGRVLRKSPPMNERPYKVKRMKLLFESGPLFYAEFNIRLFLFLLFKRCQLLLSNDLDTLLPNFLISKLKNIPLIYDSHEYFTETPELINRRFVQNIWKKIEYFCLSRLKEMITVNESIAELFRSKYGIKVYVIRNIPMQLKNFERKSREAIGLPTDKHLLVLQGAGINIQRGTEELVKAMAFLDNCFLMLIGSGDVLPKLKKMVAEMQLESRVRFFPRMPYLEMIAYTQVAELGFTLDKDTNLNYRFSLPNKLFDYIQAGVPVISSHLPEIERIIRHYNIGDFVEDHRPETIATTISEALENKSRYQIWKTNLLQAKDELCWEKEENVLLEIYKQYA
ncbi:MAG: glycosyltransferase [Lentimicrobiaceae bacterium]|nr:glycosyltransferase [Lentimicrobiaceae bacterium]